MLGERSTDHHNKDDRRGGERERVTSLLYFHLLDDQGLLRGGIISCDIPTTK